MKDRQNKTQNTNHLVNDQTLLTFSISEYIDEDSITLFQLKTTLIQNHLYSFQSSSQRIYLCVTPKINQDNLSGSKALKAHFLKQLLTKTTFNLRLGGVLPLSDKGYSTDSGLMFSLVSIHSEHLFLKS